MSELKNSGADVNFNESEESITQAQYTTFLSELEDLHKCNQALFMELKSGPSFTEGRSADTFKDPQFKRGLDDRLNSFKNRLVAEYPKYEETIERYCSLFEKLEINPFKINKAKEIGDILRKKQQ